MASENLVVGTSSNSNNGDTLRAAFIKVKKMFADMYGQTYSEQGDLSGTTFNSDVITQGSTNLFLTDDSVTNARLGVEYTASSALTSAASITVDTSLADVFTMTTAHSHTFNFTNVVVGDVKTLEITGSGGSYTSAFGTVNGSACTFNKIGGTYSDTAAKQLIQIKWTATNVAWYQISPIAS